MDKGRSQRADSKRQRRGREEPARTQPLAGHGAGDFEHNVSDVKDAEDGIVVVVLHMEVFFKTGELRVA